jgi:IS30 family transposase
MIIEQSIINLINNMPYKHFTLEQKNQLSILLRNKTKKKDIAKLLRKSRTTLWRECKRGEGINGKYYVRKSKRLAKEKRIKANARFRKIESDTSLREHIIKKLKEYWSPEQISGRWNEYHKRKRIGKDTIYKYIYTKRKDLVKHLRCQKGKYRRRYGTRIREKHREELKKRRVDARPEAVELRLEIGHWEGDTILGKDKQHILTHVERKSGLILADKLDRVTAEETRKKTVLRFKKIPQEKKKTITYDNGSTFSEHELTEKETGSIIYFAYPYHSWERPCNENANGLLRQFFPKQINFATITQREVQKAIRLLNHRPRKRLNFKTPYEIFYQKK